uniref:R3H domain-containing protein n=1 Tax=Angiostrongylus cantonensis TaxID=6313 RepID=A0A0K0D5R3_ANGCA
LELLGKLGAPTYLGTSLNHNFPPMSVEKRRFIHEYAGFFLYQSIGVDKPPKRSVIITAKRNIDDTVKIDETHEEIREESHSGSSMKTLRGSRPVKKRVAPQVSRPTPLPQFNHFAVLRSDDEEYESVSADHNAQKDVILVHERGPHWWSDEEEVVSPGNAFEIVSLMEEIVLKICNDMSFGSHNEGGSCKDSWCDNE